FSMSESKAVTVEFKRLLQPPGRKPITNNDMKCLGLIAIWGQASVISVNKGYPRFTKRFHQVFGIDTFCLSYGYDSYRWKVAYFCWMAIIIIAFLVGELWWLSEGNFQKSFFRNKSICEQKMKMLSYINYEDYANLPEFTWEEINERVQRGAYLVVCDGFVVDILDWAYSHPGGSKILVNVIGTDITNDFYNTHQRIDIDEEIDSPEVLLIPKDISSGNIPSVLTKYLSHLQGVSLPRKLSTISRLIDNINKMYYLKTPLAQHNHSRFATQRMASMVIGKVVEKRHLTINDNCSFSTFSTIQESEKTYSELNRTFIIKNIQFHRYKLTNKVMVNANVKYPVIRFTFSRIHQDENVIGNQKFLPGHYIEMQSRKEQLIGYEIQARGPFDICNRPRPHLLPTKPLTFAPYSNLGKGFYSPTSPYASPYTVFTGISSLIKTSLLNPNCLDGGTGITPMLQLIKYYLERSIKRNNDTKRNFSFKRMHLLFGNHKIVDIIDGILLEDMALSSGGQLTITYCLTDPPPDWVGFQGRINLQILQSWMNISQGIISTNQQTKIKSQTTAEDSNYMYILQDHYKPSNSDEQSKSPSPDIGSKSQLSLLSHETADTLNSTTAPNSREINVPMEKSGISEKKIKLDLVNSMQWNDVIQKKIIVCGPFNMMIAVEEALLSMGYNEQDIVMLY
ncbi:6337_t:CDS:10, partial [Dentiscutata erythropus]